MSSLPILPFIPYNNSNLSYDKNTTLNMASIVNPLESRRCVLSRGYNDFLDAHECINDGDNLSYYDILESEVSASLDDYDRCCFLLEDEYDYDDCERYNVIDNCISASYSASDIDYLCLFCEDKSLEYMRIANDEYVSELLNNLETECCICGDKILYVNFGYCDLCYAERHCFDYDDGDYNYEGDDEEDEYETNSYYDVYSDEEDIPDCGHSKRISGCDDCRNFYL